MGDKPAREMRLGVRIGQQSQCAQEVSSSCANSIRLAHNGQKLISQVGTDVTTSVFRKIQTGPLVVRSINAPNAAWNCVQQVCTWARVALFMRSIRSQREPLIATLFGNAAVSTSPAGFEFLDVARDAEQLKLFTVARRPTLERKPILQTIVWHAVTRR
jgi:hypothetical protein